MIRLDNSISVWWENSNTSSVLTGCSREADRCSTNLSWKLIPVESIKAILIQWIKAIKWNTLAIFTLMTCYTYDRTASVY